MGTVGYGASIPYTIIYRHLQTLKRYVDDNPTIMSTLTPRERVFLKWNMNSLMTVIVNSEDTEEESDDEHEEF